MLAILVYLSLVAACVVVGMTYGRWSVGSCCGCTGGCYFAQDDFTRVSVGSDWTEVAGTWSISSNQLSEAAGGGLIVWATNADSYKMTAEANFSGITGTESARVIVAYTDADNYLYGEIKGNGAGAYNVSLYQRSGGTELLLAGPLAYSSIAPYMRVCYDGSVLRLRSTQTVQLDTIGITGFTGTKAGLATGASSSVGFDNFKAAYHFKHQSGCLACGGCTHCKGNIAAHQYSITCGAVANGTHCDYTPTAACSGRNACSNYQGTWILIDTSACTYGTWYYLDEWCGDGFVGLCQLRYQAWQVRFDAGKLRVWAQAQSDGRPPSATGPYATINLAEYEYSQSPVDCMQEGLTVSRVAQDDFCSYPATITFNGPFV